MPTAVRSDAQPLTIASLIVVEELERGAAGARLHDGPVQDLLATRYLTDLALRAAEDGADTTALHARLEAIREAVVLALAGSRRTMAELTARSTDGRSLAGALRSTTAALRPAAAVTTGDAADPELGQLPPAVAVTVHRLAGALLGLCVGNAPHLAVRREGDTLVLTVDEHLDLDHPQVSGWVARSIALGARFTTEPTVEAVFALPAERPVTSEPPTSKSSETHLPEGRP